MPSHHARSGVTNRAEHTRFRRRGGGAGASGRQVEYLCTGMRDTANVWSVHGRYMVSTWSAHDQHAASTRQAAGMLNTLVGLLSATMFHAYVIWRERDHKLNGVSTRYCSIQDVFWWGSTAPKVPGAKHISNPDVQCKPF